MCSSLSQPLKCSVLSNAWKALNWFGDIIYYYIKVTMFKGKAKSLLLLQFSMKKTQNEHVEHVWYTGYTIPHDVRYFMFLNRNIKGSTHSKWAL